MIYIKLIDTKKTIGIRSNWGPLKANFSFYPVKPVVKHVTSSVTEMS